MLKSDKGFTLLEVLFVVIVIAILASIVIPRLLLTQRTAKENACAANIAMINKQIELFYFNIGRWPWSLSEMEPPTTYDYFPQGLPDCPVSGSDYEMDIDSHRVYSVGTEHNHLIPRP